MSSYGAAVIDAPESVKLSPEYPCPVCEGTNECSVLEGGESVLCSPTLAENNPVLTGGWLHHLTDHP